MGRGAVDPAAPGGFGVEGFRDCGFGRGQAEGTLDAAAGITRVRSSSLGSMSAAGMPMMVFATGLVLVGRGTALGSFSWVTAPAGHHTP
jgi:hypothetical protein